MGRPPLSKEMTRAVTVKLVRTTQQLILEEGLNAVTIRKISQCAGINSAVLYKYFQDLDELLLFACVDVLRYYYFDVQNAGKEPGSTPRDTFLSIWRCFCDYSFRYPDCIRHLFFSKHSEGLETVIVSYYQLFPEQLSGMPDLLQQMATGANQLRRNLTILRPVLEGHTSPERIDLINDIMISYFHSLLDQCITAGTTADPKALTQRMMDVMELLTAWKE